MLSGHPLCDQTVTVYRLEEDGVVRNQIDNCFFRWEDVVREDEMGQRLDRKFRLIVPGPEQQVFVGCRVLPGSGPQITPAQWPQFIPAKVQNLCDVEYASPKYFAGSLHHTEAGRN